MTDLAEIQRQFAAALLDPSAPVPSRLRRCGSGAPRKRFAVYRNNVVVSLISALAARFPVVHRLAGDEFFRPMARAYVMEQPPRSPVLLDYGDAFPAFIERFALAASIEYLADVARLELARGRAYHAADAAPIDVAALACWPPDELAEVRVAVHPSVSLIDSRFPVVSIWQAHQKKDLAPILDWQPEAALVARPLLEVEIWRLPPGGHGFLSRLTEGMTMAAAAEATAAMRPDFDLVSNLAVLVRANVVVDFHLEPLRPAARTWAKSPFR